MELLFPVGPFACLGVPVLELIGTYDLTMTNATGMCEAFDENERSRPASVEPPRLKVLLITDNAASSRRAEKALSHMSLFEPQITTAGTVAAARFALLADEFDVTLVDADMRDGDGSDINAVLAGLLDAGPVLSLEAGTMTPKGVQVAIDQAITTFAQRCSTRI